MLTWHNVWMARHGREMARSFKAAGQAVASGARNRMAALAVVVALAVLREGFEVVMFLYGVLATRWRDRHVGVRRRARRPGAWRAGLRRDLSRPRATFPAKYLFGVTGVLIAFLAAGMAAQAVNFLAQANCRHRARRDGLGHVVAALREQRARPRAAHADRLQRPPDAACSWSPISACWP